MRGLPVDHDIQGAIISPLEQGVEKGTASILLHLHSEFDGWSHTVEVVQESFYCALLHNTAGVIYMHISSRTGANLRASSSNNSMYRFATTADTGEPIACHHIHKVLRVPHIQVCLYLVKYHSSHSTIQATGGTALYVYEAVVTSTVSMAAAEYGAPRSILHEKTRN